MKINDYLPKHKAEKMKMAQALVPEGIWEAVNLQREKMGVSWPVLIKAMFLAFLDERKDATK